MMFFRAFKNLIIYAFLCVASTACVDGICIDQKISDDSLFLIASIGLCVSIVVFGYFIMPKE